jgi:hypothetical protein
MALQVFLPLSDLRILLLLPISLITIAIYRRFFHPLSHIPGPPLACVSSIFLYAICYWGVEGRVLLYYHEKYRTSVLRIAPNAVSLSDGEALHPIYVAGGGLPKDARYSNFRVDGHDTIFSARNTDYRDFRAKAVLPLFAPSRVRASCENDGVIAALVKKFVDRLEEKAPTTPQKQQQFPGKLKEKRKKKVDILDLSSRLSIDVLTGYLFNNVYGGLDEQDEVDGDVDASTGTTTTAAQTPRRWANKLSATPFVLAIVAFSRFSLLPSWLFSIIFSALVGRVLSDEEVTASLKRVDEFAARIMDPMSSYTDTYQSRLTAVGISRTETLIQCKAAMFAGADSTAIKLATILFHLVQQPDIRLRLLDEIRQSPPGVDPQSLPYLRAVIREGLRLGMANPVRLTRILPSDSAGLTVSGVYIPPGTIVGAAAYVFHHNPTVFPKPFEFRPERWLDDKGDNEAQRRRMRERDMFAFGLGSRACLGRTLATQQLFEVVRAVVDRGVLQGARTCKDKIELIEWFNAEITGHELEIEW